VKSRELLTFSIILSLGGCEPQLKGHIQFNINVGNDKAFLLAVVTQLLPFIGYPRALNAIACLNEVLPETKASQSVGLGDRPPARAASSRTGQAGTAASSLAQAGLAPNNRWAEPMTLSAEFRGRWRSTNGRSPD